MSHSRRFRTLLILAALIFCIPQMISAAPTPHLSAALQQSSSAQAPNAKHPPLPRRQPAKMRGHAKANASGDDGEPEDDPFGRAEQFYLKRTAGSAPIDVTQASDLRDKAIEALLASRPLATQGQAIAPAALTGAWSAQGPNPIVQLDYTGTQARAVAGRIGALAVRSTAPYTIYLGAAQGGIWVSSTLTLNWTPRTDQLQSLAIGAIALAPSNEDIVYVGTGEGSLSGDSYWGSGVLKSTNAGRTFTKVSGATFTQVSISKIAVDPTNPNHLWVASLPGVAGAVPVRAASPTAYGIWESVNGGVNWTARATTTDRLHGATDLVIDPLYNGTSNKTLYASFWTQGISKTLDGGLTWTSAMNGLPAAADFADPATGTRFSLGISHPSAATPAVLYTGFDYTDTGGTYHRSFVWKSTDAAATWAAAGNGGDGIDGYCNDQPGSNYSQCYYDNVIGVDPNDPNTVYALGLFNYSNGTGGVFRSTDGGANWLDLGYGLHPDYHAIAIRKDAPQNIVIGNDGGVWSSPNRGGRLTPGDPATAVDWVDLNGGAVNQNDFTVDAPTDLQITQFTSIAQHPTNNRLYGGAQDNGTMRKFNTPNSSPWIDWAGGDGGHTLVDPYAPNFVYGTYFNIDPYRFSDGMASFSGLERIANGLDTTEASEFYVPFVMDPWSTNRLYLGTIRVYATENRGELWRPITGDLTEGCPGRSATTNYFCDITALDAAGGTPAMWAGTGDARVWLITHTDAVSPTAQRVDSASLPLRPISSIAVDKSNYRVAYVGYSGFDETTTVKGHLFKTTNGGQSWTNVTGAGANKLPDVPLNWVELEQSNPNIIFVGTDIGPWVTTDGGTNWATLGSGFPLVATNQLNYSPFKHELAAATHGRGAWILTDGPTLAPALQAHAQDAGIPVGPGSVLTYTLTVRNIGNAAATGVGVTAAIPANTTFTSADSGGAQSAGNVIWSGLTVPAATASATTGGLVPGELRLVLTVRIANSVVTGGKITLDGISVTSTEGPGATGSPIETPIAPANALTLSPSDQTGGARIGGVVTYTLSLQNLGYATDSYTLSAAGNKWPTTIWNASDTSQIAQLGAVGPGATASFIVKVSVPLTATHGVSDTATLSATSVANPGLKATARVTTIAVNRDVLLVDNDNNQPDVASYYQAALTSNASSYSIWDLAANPDLPLSYMKAYKAIVWFTGASYPEPFALYDANLSTYLDSGGKLFMSTFDGLDQAGGSTSFAHDYLHIEWDSVTQNDVDAATITVTAVLTNPVTGNLGALPVNGGSPPFSYCNCNDVITPIGPAIPAFTSSSGIDALTVTDVSPVTGKSYKVVLLAFPFEAIGTPSERTALMKASLAYFLVPHAGEMYLPVIRR